MGLLDKLTVNGSFLSFHDGSTPPINPLSTKKSNLHYDAQQQNGGASIRGSEISNYPLFFRDYLSYENGASSYIPPPSILELGDPIGSDPNYKPTYTPSNTYKSKIQSLNQ
jgi:hypothetical protein